MMQKEKGKTIAAEKALTFVQDNMIVGLGTGSTADIFIELLGEKCRQGLSVLAIASSERTMQKAKEANIPLIDLNEAPYVDKTFDGADYVDLQKQMIKGKGGALLKEKILASSSQEVIIFIDESKKVLDFKEAILPVEVVWFGAAVTQRKLEKKNYFGSFRMDKDGSFFLTENGNLILDIRLKDTEEDPKKIHQKISEVPGVVETGFFFDLASKVIVGYENGKVEIF